MEQMEMGFKGGSQSADPTCALRAPLLNDIED